MSFRLIVLLSFTLAACNEAEQHVPEKEAETPAFHTPSIIIETIDEIVAGLPEEGRKAIAEMESEEGMSMYHHGWGTGVRNSQGLWNDSELAKAFKEIGIWHADDMSAILLDSVWRRVRGEDLNIQEQVDFYKAYYVENKHVLDEPCPQCSEILDFRQSIPLVYIEHPDLKFADYLSQQPEFPEVEKMLQYYECPNGHEYIRTSELGFCEPSEKHLDALKRKDRHR